MDLRTKLVFALVAVALGSMLAFGWLAFGSARSLLRESALEQLDAVAESRKESVERVLLGWRERVQVVARSTRVRQSVREVAASGSTRARQTVVEILEDAVRSSPTLESLAVVDAAGNLVAVGGAWTSPGDAAELIARGPAEGAPGYQGLSSAQAGLIRVIYREGLAMGGEEFGSLYARIRGGELREVTGDVGGPGDTGETLIAFRDTAAAARVLTAALRPGGPESGANPDGGGPRIAEFQEGTIDPALLALDGEEGAYTEGMIDYRGEPVWAATRYIAETGWGMVVKVDASEREAAVTELRRTLQQLGVSLAAFAILLGTLLGFHFARPIHELAGVARQVQEGELDARAATHRQDEIGLLARTFNEMTGELERRLNELKEFHTYFEMAPDLLCIAGTDGYFKRTNPAFERTLGWTAEELRERPFFDLVHPDDVEATRAEVARLAEGIPTIRFRNRYRCADGSYRTLRWTCQPEPETGLLYAAARDVTELTRARERLAAAEQVRPPREEP